MVIKSPRSEFVAENVQEVQYERTGGCFVTTRTAVVFVVLAIIVLIAVGALMYFFGPHTEVKEDDQMNDIEKLLNDSINSIGDQYVRLPSHIRPIYYRLRIHPHLDEPNDSNFTFYGEVAILIKCGTPSTKIVLNVEDLKIFTEDTKVTTTKKLSIRSLPQVTENATTEKKIPDSTKLTVQDGAATHDVLSNNSFISTTSVEMTSSIPTLTTNHDVTTKTNLNVQKIVNIKIKSQEYNKKDTTYTIRLEKLLDLELNYTIHFKFAGKITNNLVGLYKTSYSDGNGNKRWLLATNFEPVYARRVFPCFDEPSFKSSFEISVARRTNMSVLSNMPLKSYEKLETIPNESKGWVWDHFKPTPPMSPHLVTFVISNFKKAKVPYLPNLNTDFHVWVPENKLASTRFARQISTNIFLHLEAYFQEKYPLPKLDMVALPELPQRATDGWGLILFRDSSLLLDYNTHNVMYENEIFNTIVRKLTTQWFGNLVTIRWWSGMWLVEGFSTFMENEVENVLQPEVEDLDSFSLRVTQTILDTDQLKSVRSLSDQINDLADVEQIFDDVAINKGSCLIRMLNYTVGESVFKQSVENFLNDWKFKSVKEDVFWDSFTQVIENSNSLEISPSINDFMHSWINQEGYPLVTVIRNYATGDVNINQTRFIYGLTDHNNTWFIPLSYRRKHDFQTKSVWLNKKSLHIENFTLPGKENWLLFNVNQAGFYRVNYDETNWMILQNQLNSEHHIISPSNRGQILSDAFELAYAGLLNYHIPFELTKYLRLKERHYIPWNSIFNSLRSLEYIIGTTYQNGVFRKYAVDLVQPIYDELGTSEKPGDPQSTKLLRTFIIKVACHFKYEPCLDWAKNYFHDWMVYSNPDKTNPIPSEIRSIVQCTAIRNGGEKEWNFLWQRTLYPLISPVNLKTAYASLGCSQEPWIINNYLEKSLNGNISLQNVPDIWRSIAHPVGINIGFIFLRTKWEKIYSSYLHINSITNTIFEEFLSKLSTEIDLQDLTSFYKANKEKLQAVSSLMLSVVDRIKWRILWNTNHMDTVADWLKKNHK